MVLLLANSDPKPNFTQYQLKLMELGALPMHFKALRKAMENKFKLVDLDELLDKELDARTHQKLQKE